MLMGQPVLGQDGAVLGRVRDFAVDPELDTGHVSSLLLKLRGEKALVAVGIGDIHLSLAGELRLKSGVSATKVDNPHLLLLERDLLDQQIIDIHGHKVVRVNDVDFCWESADSEDRHKLRLAQVEVGLRGALRRLLKGLPKSLMLWIESVPPRVIPWEFVDLIERDPARRVRLKIEQNRLANMHPSDIADILEELAPAEREAVFASLDEEIAAEALEEVDPKLQKQLIEGLDSERVAEIVEEMDPGAAADLLAELSEERSEAILEEMDPEERQEVEDLLEFSEHSAAGRMTTDYISVGEKATVGDAIQVLRDFEGDIDLITDILIVDEQDKLKGLVSVSKLLLAASTTKLMHLVEGRLVSTPADSNTKHVAELFDKYNLRSLPVVDEEEKLVGVIYAEHVISLLREGR